MISLLIFLSVGLVITFLFFCFVYFLNWDEARSDVRNTYGRGWSPTPGKTRFGYWAYSRGYVSGQKRNKKNADKPDWRKLYEDKAKAKIAALDKAEVVKDAEPDEEF